MQIIFLDYETYYDNEFSLRKMTPVEYILDPRFEVIGAAVKRRGGLAQWIEGPDLPAYFASLNPNEVMLVSHNALFDACITSWVFGFRPALTACTLSIARAMIGHELKGLSLSSVGQHLGYGQKLYAGAALSDAKGMHLADLKHYHHRQLYQRYIDYAIRDDELCEQIFDELVLTRQFPMSELRVLDMTLRMATEPKFILDPQVLSDHLTDVLADKDVMMAKAMLLGATKTNLMSNEKFAELLRSFGVEPPMKVSPTTGKMAYAFAKTDVEFLALQDDANEAVQILMDARLGFKSTIEETRTRRFINIANLTPPSNMPKGMMPMPINFSGAHTHRFSGAWSLNVQNLRRGGKLRKALRAPPGMKVVTGDASQIEARLTAWLSECASLVKQFANGEDVYSNFASTTFNMPVNKKDNPDERFVGKQAILGLGFGLGHLKFQQRLKTDSQNQMGRMISLEEHEAKRVVDTYRTTFWEVPRAWRILTQQGIPALLGDIQGFRFGPCEFEKETIWMPNVDGTQTRGLALHYHGLHWDDELKEYTFTHGGIRKRLYGGKLLENIVQGLDRVIVVGAALRVQKMLHPYGLAQQAHDENAYVVPEGVAPLVQQLLLQELKRRPWWAPDLPLDAEVSQPADTYGDAK